MDGHTSTKVRRALIALLTIVATVAASGSSVAGAQEDHADAREPLLLLGDSLCVGARDHEGNLIGLLRARGWEPELVCKEGMPLAWGIEQVRVRKSVPSTVVVALGTNPGPVEDEFSERIAQMREELRDRGAHEILWVNYSNRADGYRDKNDALLRSAVTNQEIYVDWAARVRDNPHWFHRDGLHYGAAGRRAWARTIAEATEVIPGHRPYFARAVVPEVVRPPLALPRGDDRADGSSSRNTFGFAQLWCVTTCSAARTTARH